MQAVGDKGRRTDRPADPDPVDRDQLVAGEPDDAGSDHDTDVVDLLRVEQPPYGLDAGHHCGHRDHDDDEHPGEVLRAAVAVGVAARGRPSAEYEGDPQRDGGQGVGEVVDGVGEQGHRAGGEHDQGLRGRRDEERDQADLDRPDALRAGLERRVDRVRGVVAVRPEDRRDPAAHSAGLVVVVVVVVVMWRSVVAVGLDRGRGHRRSWTMALWFPVGSAVKATGDRCRLPGQSAGRGRELS